MFATRCRWTAIAPTSSSASPTSSYSERGRWKRWQQADGILRDSLQECRKEKTPDHPVSVRRKITVCNRRRFKERLVPDFDFVLRIPVFLVSSFVWLLRFSSWGCCFCRLRLSSTDDSASAERFEPVTGNSGLCLCLSLSLFVDLASTRGTHLSTVN
ncbi:hypothetical protein GE09DRAFT_1148829 [Coniochaeta sp. 2T2.1]|nr:hypothetical protein GE09DRAFT_1148829 [Coniochaeta sp. 2T2.1]